MIQGDYQRMLDDYARAFASGQKPAQPIAGFQARLCRRNAGQEVRLSDDPNRRIVFLMGHGVCHEIIGLDGYRIATSVCGWDPQYTKKKVDAGQLFDLVVFPENACKLSTWHNTLDLVGEVYPEIAEKLERHRQTLALMTPQSLIEIERRQGYTFLEVDELGSQDKRFMSLSRYIEAPDTVDAARAFLYHVVYCKELFTGNGCTTDTQGHPGVAEFIMPNRPLAALGPHVIIPIEIKIP